jgi:hypothetical protein
MSVKVLSGTEARPRVINEAIRQLQLQALDTIKTGSLAGTSVTITDIPAYYSGLILKIAGASSGSTEQLYVQASVDNGTTIDTTAGNYPGHKVTGTTWTAMSVASLIESATFTSAQTGSVMLYIDGYQGGPNARTHARVITNATEYQCWSTYIGSTSAITALKILGSAGGTFDAGTYTLYGVR